MVSAFRMKVISMCWEAQMRQDQQNPDITKWSYRVTKKLLNRDKMLVIKMKT